MIAKVTTASVVGLDAEIVEVEADIANGLPNTIIVGLPDTAVQESRERVRSAIKNSEFSYPQTRVSVNLAPADLPKNGTLFDVPIALAILISSGQVAFDTSTSIFVGELSLDGTVRPVPGVLAIALAAKHKGFTNVFVPTENAHEAALVEGVCIYPIASLREFVAHALGYVPISPQARLMPEQLFKNTQTALDMCEIAGQELAKRALEIACAGGHNVL